MEIIRILSETNLLLLLDNLLFGLMYANILYNSFSLYVSLELVRKHIISNKLKKTFKKLYSTFNSLGPWNQSNNNVHNNTKKYWKKK